jgi:hypothetical protein
MENGDLATVNRWHLQLQDCIVKIVDCTMPANILVRVMVPKDDDTWYARFPTWYVHFDALEVISDPRKVDQLEAEICFKNL